MRKNILLKSILLLALLVLNLVPLGSALAEGTYDANTFKEQSGLNKTAEVGGYDVSANSTTPEQLVGKAIYVVLGFIGVIFMILLIYGGFVWMTAGGNEEKVKKANGILMSSMFGLIIILSAYVISYFILGRLGGK